MIEYDKYCFKSKEKPKYIKKKKKPCLVCEKKRDNENTTGVKLENKIGQQKTTCANCGSRKSTFLKPIKKNVFTNYKTCKFIVKPVKSTQETHFQEISPYFKKYNQRKIKMCNLFD